MKRSILKKAVDCFSNSNISSSKSDLFLDDVVGQCKVKKVKGFKHRRKYADERSVVKIALSSYCSVCICDFFICSQMS